ncbi:unnamed protein product [Ectocarpus fasciculatus]
MIGVVIVGAGLSGLVSALHLLDSGVSSDAVTIVDGRERVGGRLESHQGVDVGGAWCWTSAHHQMPALAQRFGVAHFLQYDKGVHVIDYGSQESVARIRQPLDSAKVRFQGGAAAVTDALANYVRAKGVSIVLNCVVNKISTTDADAVLVEGIQLGEAKSWRAGAVLLAIPPRLVLPPLISWEPSLPAELAEAAGATPTWMADTTKVLVTYQRPFWREQGLSGTGMGYGEGPINQLYDSCGPEGSEPHALCGFIFGAGADLPGDDILRPWVIEQLERMFGADARSVLSFSSHRWGEQPLTSGNGGGTGGHEDMGKIELRIPFGSASHWNPPRVWLSAAETDASHAGLMEGALCAGKRVAEQVILAGIVAPEQGGETAKEGEEEAT